MELFRLIRSLPSQSPDKCGIMTRIVPNDSVFRKRNLAGTVARTIDVHQGETFTGRMCLDLVRIEINGIQYKASRNDFSLVRYLPHD